SWVLTGFLVSASIATPIVGKLGDLYGKGRVLTAVMTLFAAGAVISALAPSIAVVIAGRVLQGVAGGVFPLAVGLVRDTFPRDQVAGGLANVSLIALPLAFAAHRLIPPSPPVEHARVDWLGAGVVLVGVFVAIEGRVAQPLIDLDVLRKPAVAATNLTGFMVGVAMFASFLIFPQFAQTPERAGYGFGFDVTAAGLLMMPTALAQLAAGPPAAKLAERIGFRALLSLGGVLMGAGMTFSFAAMANLIVEAVPQREVGIATGINMTAILTAGTRPLPTESAYTAAFAISAGAGVLALLASRLVPRPGPPGVRLEPVTG
ncbi:MAG TPA: MFS transporter, partial [Solirubrobacter sp.]|nr:MFS transporter [Solirubrobacter sp.]